MLDPIDGTKAFITGIPIYGTLISLARHGTPIVGVIDHPITNDRWSGAKGLPSTLNGQRIRSPQCGSLAEALLSCSNPEPFGPREREAFETLREATKWCVYGSSCYAYGCIASGTIDIGIDCGRHREVDYCALVPVIEGAAAHHPLRKSPGRLRKSSSTRGSSAHSCGRIRALAGSYCLAH